MKRNFIFLVCLSLMIGLCVPAFAISDRETPDEANYVYTKVLTTTGAVTGRATWVYAVTIDATSATAFVNVYDAADSTGSAVIEVSEATSGDSKRYVFARPVKFTTGVYCAITNGNAIVEYR